MILFPWSFCVQLHLLAQNSTVGVNLRAENIEINQERERKRERGNKIQSAILLLPREGFIYSEYRFQKWEQRRYIIVAIKHLYVFWIQ